MIDLSSATIQGIKTLSDGCLRVTLDCREMEAIDMLCLLTAFKKGEAGVLIPEVGATEEDRKSPAERLRGALYVYWEQNTSKEKTFEEFYRSQMERFISTVKDKLT